MLGSYYKYNEYSQTNKGEMPDMIELNMCPTVRILVLFNGM